MSGMTRERALDINSKLCAGYFFLNGLGDYTLPDISDVSLKDAIAATEIVSADPVIKHNKGSKTITASIALEKVPYWYAQIVGHWTSPTTVLTHEVQK